MSTQPDTIKRIRDFIRNSPTLKVLSIGALIFILLVPIYMIRSLMGERESNRDFAVRKINQKWGKSQTITGPFFTIPYRVTYKNDYGTQTSRSGYIHILPEKLNISGKLAPEIRYRSIYEAVLYNTQISISGNFVLPPMNQANIPPDSLLWDKAIFSMGITDMRGIQENIEVTFNEKTYGVSPGLKTADIAPSGVSSVIPFPHSSGSNSFSVKLNLNGSDQLQFIPIAEETKVEIDSSWPSPSFNGAFLPATRNVNDNGFTASWKILNLARNFPQTWEGGQYEVNEAAFGVKLLITADIYQKSIRITKYALVFIIFTFSAFFFSEILNKKRVHPIQYLLIGLAIILFYILLLSISEHIRFDYAYILSAVAITLLITGYSKGIIKSPNFTVTIFSILSILYSYLYIVLQLEDYALIMGSLGLLAVLGIVMYITRKVDWYSLDTKPDGPSSLTISTEKALT